MRFLAGVCLGLIAFNAMAQNEDDTNDGFHAKVYSDVSKKAQQNAIKYDGWKILGGLTYSMSMFSAGAKGSVVYTENNINNFMLTFGLDYSKRFRKRFLLGAVGLLDIWKAQRKGGDWQDFNYEYYSRVGPNYWNYGTLDGGLKTQSIIPEFAVKGGYIFRRMGTVVYLKAGAQYMRCEYVYTNSGLEVCSYEVVKFVPLIGFGGQKRLNKKFGIAFELNFPFKRDYEKTIDNLTHRVKVGRKTIRVLVTYSIPGKIK